nr:hypothetical protein [Tanacetum cinerariifolium]
MADVNVNAPADQAPTMTPPTRTDDQIPPHIRWVPIGKSNCYSNVEKSQSNPIYKIAMDILKHANFFRVFTASSIIPSIYIQQFWDTDRIMLNLLKISQKPDNINTRSEIRRKAGSESSVFKNKSYIEAQFIKNPSPNEQWFDLTKDTLRDALQITPINNNNAFSSPPSSDALINFVNDLGYPKVVRNLSNVVTNDMFQPWRALTTIIHLCLTGKTFGFERPRALRKHKFYPRPDSPLHLPNEEHVLGYLKFSAKGTKREVFEMPIPGNLITADIQGSDPDSPAPKPTKATKKSKPSAPKADLRPPVTKPASSQQPEPKPAPSKSMGKKHKLVMETSDKPSPARKSRSGLEPRFDDEEADVQRALEESLKSIYDAPRGPLPLVVIREPERTSTPTGSSGHDESSSLYAKLGLTGSEVESDEDVPGMDAGVQDEGQARPNPGEQDEGQAGLNPGDAAASQPQSSFVVHAGPNLKHTDLKVTDVSTQPHLEQMDEGFTATAYPKVQENLKLTVEEQVILEEPTSSTGTLYSLQHLVKDLNFGDLFFNDKPSEANNEKTTAKTKAESMVSVTIQEDTSIIPPMTTPIVDLTSRPDSPNVHRPLQATATETTTTTHPPPPQPQQSTTYSMLMKCIGELEHIMTNLIQDNKHLEERLDSHGARLYTLENLDIPQQVRKAVDEIVTDAVDWAIQASLRNRFRDLPEANMKEILHQRMWETNSYKTHEDHMMLYKALEKSMNRDHTEELLKDLAEARKKKKKRRDSPKTPPGSPLYQPPPPPPPAGPSGTSGSPGSSQVLPPLPPPPSTNQEGQSHGSAAPSSSKTTASAEYKAWTTTDTRLRPSVSSTPEDLQMDDDMAPDAQVHSSDDEDIGNAHIPKVNLRQDWWKPLEEDRPATSEPAWSILSSDFPVPKNNWVSALASTYSPPPEDSLLAQTGDMAMFMDWFCKRQGITELKPQDLKGPAFELVKVFHPNVIHMQYQIEECYKLLTDSVDDSIIKHNVSKPLPMGGRPGQMKASYYPDIGLEKMVPDQMWIEEECKYDIAAIHTSEGDRRAVRTHMRILSVVRIELFSMYGQRVKDFQLGIESYQTQLNLTKPRWDATGFEYMHDYMVIDSPRAVTFRDRWGSDDYAVQ